ncbi:MAG TPA: FtsX-like permease family protein [Ktedonobacterales bacterium]|nr:FtsX-like permease family protein [Ktedonobacterales bacterium]
MTSLKLPTPPSRKKSFIPPTMILAFWQGRETWRLLMVAGLGVVVAVTLMCAVPLFSTVSLTAGVRAVLNASPQDSEMLLSTSASSLNDTIFTNQIAQPLQAVISQQVGSYLNPSPEFILQTPGMDFISSDSGITGGKMALLGFNPGEATSHSQLLQGQLPQQTSADLQIAISQKTAEALHAAIGSIIQLRFSFSISPTQGQGVTTQPLDLHVTGIFAPKPDDPYWQGFAFDPTPLGTFLSYTALMSTNTYLALLTQMGHAAGETAGQVFFAEDQQPLLNWYYHFDVNHVTINNLNDLIERLATAQVQLAIYAGPTGLPPAVHHAQISGPAVSLNTPSTLERYRDRVSVASIPANILALQLVALILFFISMIADLIVERQTGVIALLRSRGATRRQIFGLFITQSLGVGFLALAAGPLLAIPTARILGRDILAQADQNALNVLDGNPFQIAFSLRWFALAVAACAVFAMLIAARGAASRDVLALRREAARSTHRPLWRRLNLDMFFIAIALTSFILSLYVTNSGAVDARSNLLISTPLALVAPMLLVLAGILLFLRFFPFLLRLGAWLSARRAAAPSMIAIAQMARSPRQATRMILLLALASSFGMFTLIFAASQEQQMFNNAAHQVGADFNGFTPPSARAQPSLAQQTAAYRRIPGVISASLGYSSQASLEGSTLNLPLEVRAVDTSTYAQTAIWTPQDATQPLASLMQELVQKSASAPVPIAAIVDALAWSELHLAPGTTFRVALPGSATPLTFVAIDEVQHIPTVNDSLLSAGTSDYSPPGGMVIDYAALRQATKSTISYNQVWLRTTDDPTLLGKVRAALSKGPLALLSVSDRRAILAQAQRDPLYSNLIGVLTLGAVIALFLALVGNLITSWVSARSRLTSFAMLRALGSTPNQIASVLLFEQGIVYGAGIALGIFFGVLLAETVVPAMVINNTPQAAGVSSDEFYVLQHILPVQIVIPGWLLIALGLLVLLCVIALGIMARIVSKPSISQALRLNDD